MKIVTGASSHEGASILLNAPSGGYVAGTAYTFSIYIEGNAGGEAITLQLGTSSDNATSAITATTGFVQYDVNWTPGTTAVTGVYALVKTTNATAITGYADGAMVTLASVGLAYFDGDTHAGAGEVVLVGGYAGELELDADEYADDAGHQQSDHGRSDRRDLQRAGPGLVGVSDHGVRGPGVPLRVDGRGLRMAEPDDHHPDRSR